MVDVLSEKKKYWQFKVKMLSVNSKEDEAYFLQFKYNDPISCPTLNYEDENKHEKFLWECAISRKKKGEWWCWLIMKEIIFSVFYKKEILQLYQTWWQVWDSHQQPRGCGRYLDSFSPKNDVVKQIFKSTKKTVEKDFCGWTNDEKS